jgi:serine/alanine adding enzyme
MNLPDIYFLPEWGKAFQELDNGEACIFDYEDVPGHIYYQFIKRKIPYKLNSNTYYDIITPYGFSGPVILENNKPDEGILVSKFEDSFNEYCIKEHIISEYVRFNPWLRNHLDFERIYKMRSNNYTLYIDLTVNDIFMDEFCSKIRNKIRKAKKSGVQLEFDFSGLSLNEFSRLYQFTIEKNDITDYYKFSIEFLEKVFKALNNRQFLINARFDGKLITSAIFMDYGDYLHFHLVANDPNFYPLQANSLIMHEASMWGQKNGKKQMHIGGAFTDELFAYKKQFTKNGISDFYIGNKIRNEEIYNKLVDLRYQDGGNLNSTFFPLYRG